MKVASVTKWSIRCLFLFIFSAKVCAQPSIEKEIQQGIALYQKSDFSSAKTVFKQLLTKKISLKDLLQVQNNLGNVYADLGQNKEALNYYHLALKTAKRLNSSLDEAKIYKNIGALYLSWKNFDKARGNYFLALSTATRVGDTKLLGDCYNNLGTVYEQINQLDSAEIIYQLAVKCYEDLNSQLDLAMVYSNLAIVLKNKGNPKLAVEYNIKALEMSKAGGDLWMVAAISNNIGNALKELGHYEKALQYAEYGLQVADSIKATEVSIIALETLAAIHERMGHHLKANTHLRLMIKRNEEFINLNQTQQFNELEVKYKTKEKQRVNEQLKRENVLQQNAAKYKAYVLIISFVFIIFILGLFLWFRQRKIKRDKERDISLAIESSESKERFRIAADLHDSIGQQLSFLKMKLASSQEGPALIPILDDTIKEVRTISHNLIPEALNFGLIVALEEMCAKGTNSSMVQMHVHLDIREQDIVFDKEKRLMVFRIIQELFGNAVRHAHATQMKLKGRIAFGYIEFELTDNGKGFDPKLISSSKGLGWKSIYRRLELVKGTIEINSTIGKGTIIRINLPND